MTQQLREHAALPEDPSLVPSIHVRQTTATWDANSRGSSDSSLDTALLCNGLPNPHSNTPLKTNKYNLSTRTWDSQSGDASPRQGTKDCQEGRRKNVLLLMALRGTSSANSLTLSSRTERQFVLSTPLCFGHCVI